MPVLSMDQGDKQLAGEVAQQIENAVPNFFQSFKDWFGDALSWMNRNVFNFLHFLGREEAHKLVEQAKQINLNQPDWGRLLRQAAASNNVSMIHKIASAQKVSLNAQSKEEKTPLMVAIEKGHDDAIKALVHLGADIDFENRNGLTAFIHAVQLEQKAAIKLLLSLGADINFVNNKQMTPLMYAVYAQNNDMIVYLLDLGADIDAYGFQGLTALYRAVNRGYVDQVELLVKRGANKAIFGFRNLTPMQLAQEQLQRAQNANDQEKQKRFEKIIQLLQ